MIGGLLSLLGTLGYYGSYAFVIYDTVVGALTIGALYFLTGAIAGASTNIQAVFATFSTIADRALFVTDLLDFFAMKPTVASKPNALPVPRPILQGFEFRNVSFTYPGHTRLVLSDVSFHLKRGERLALVGENGQGKTTIVKLLTRLYDPTAGQILLDGVDLRDAQLLILDEPTAGLDAKSEHEVFQRFAELTHGKMALLISHRFSTVKMADRILVLEQGQIAEQGDHEELLLRGGRYAEMFELQAASYR